MLKGDMTRLWLPTIKPKQNAEAHSTSTTKRATGKAAAMLCGYFCRTDNYPNRHNYPIPIIMPDEATFLQYLANKLAEARAPLIRWNESAQNMREQAEARRRDILDEIQAEITERQARIPTP